MPAKEQKESVVERSDIRYTKHKMSADSQAAGDLVKNPKNLFRVLQYLISDEEIDAFVPKRESGSLDIEHVNLVHLSLELRRELAANLQRTRLSIRMSLLHDS